MTTYQLPDEPRPSRLSQLAMDPMWPFFGTMLVGLWFGMAWYMFNSFALGSPNWKKELGLVGLAVFGKAALILSLVAAAEAGWLDKPALPYAFVLVTALGLGCAYALNQLQARTFELYTYFGGEAKNGAVVLLVGMLVLREPVGKWLGEGLLGAVLR